MLNVAHSILPPNELLPSADFRCGYPIHNFDEHFKDSKSPIQWVFLERLTEEQKAHIDPGDAADELFGPRTNSQDRTWLILGLLKRLTGGYGERVAFFKDHWSYTDAAYELGGTILFQFGSFESCQRFWSYLTDDENTWISSLDDEFAIYRGCDESKIDGTSWTTVRSAAEGFAHGHRGTRNPSPVVVSAKCYKENILMATNDREAFEIIVDPSWLEDVWVSPFQRKHCALASKRAAR